MWQEHSNGGLGRTQVALTNNTTDHLVEDINVLRAALGIAGKMHVFGGSWGSTLALTYGIRYPQNVATLILRGIFLGAHEYLLYLYQGNAETYHLSPITYHLATFALTAPGAYVAYPDEWRAFVSPIPPEDRSDMIAAYKAMFDAAPIGDAERQTHGRVRSRT